MSFFKNALAWAAKSFLPWATQKTTISGIATAAGAITGLALGSVTWPVAVPMLVGSLVAMAIPEGDTASTVQAAVTQAIAVASGKVLPLVLAGLLAFGLVACGGVKTYGQDALDVAGAAVDSYAKSPAPDVVALGKLRALLAVAQVAEDTYAGSSLPADAAAVNAAVSALIAYEASLHLAPPPAPVPMDALISAAATP